MSESKLVYVESDLFTAPDHSILVHACNTLGSWGSGIALAFRQNYPAQFAQYKTHCEAHGEALIGTCLLIPGDKHDIACLFTSRAYGRHKDKPNDILTATRKAVKGLEAQNLDNKELHAWLVEYWMILCHWIDILLLVVSILESLLFLGKIPKLY